MQKSFWIYKLWNIILIRYNYKTLFNGYQGVSTRFPSIPNFQNTFINFIWTWYSSVPKFKVFSVPSTKLHKFSRYLLPRSTKNFKILMGTDHADSRYIIYGYPSLLVNKTNYNTTVIYEWFFVEFCFPSFQDQF